jgi:hypothetical protein
LPRANIHGYLGWQYVCARGSPQRASKWSRVLKNRRSLCVKTGKQDSLRVSCHKFSRELVCKRDTQKRQVAYCTSCIHTPKRQLQYCSTITPKRQHLSTGMRRSVTLCPSWTTIHMVRTIRMTTRVFFPSSDGEDETQQCMVPFRVHPFLCSDSG